VDQVHPHGSALKAYLRGSFPAVRDVDDLVQESFLRVWKAQATRPINSAKAFLFKVAQRLALDWLRHERASPLSVVTDFGASSVIEDRPGVADAVSTEQEISFLLEAIDTLPPRCREILILRKLKGLPQKEVAERLRLSEQTVHTQIARGINRCEVYLLRKGVRL
jgi:RNA polymerase sigma factor (sigma-70 family)